MSKDSSSFTVRLYKPYKEVVSSTMSDSYKRVLNLVSIDTIVHKAHSIHSAVTS